MPKIARTPSLAGLVYRVLTAEDTARTHEEYLHVSDLHDLCARQVFLAKQDGVTVTRKIDPGMWMRFRMGEQIEDLLCEEVFVKRLDILAERQPVVRNTDLKVQGHPDGRMKNGQLLEIKAMAPELFKLSARYPLPKHQFQVQTYLFLDEQQPTGKLFSCTYGQDKMPFRDIDINFNLKVGEAIKKTVGSLREAEAGGPLPGRVCQSADDKRALRCPVQQRCFALANPTPALTIGEALKADR